MEKTFQALWVTEESDGTFRRQIVERRISDLPDHPVLVRVRYSSLNYKDALSAAGNRGVTRRYPHTPGIDAAGIVEDGGGTEFQPGDEVVVCCYDLGMNTPGGFGQYIRVPAEWIVRRPAGLSLKETMILGTGGFTAAGCVHRLVQLGLEPEAGPVVVTGATGGVGSFAVALLARLGFSVTAVSGKPDAEAFLRDLGAAKVVDRDRILQPAERFLGRPRWAGGVDTVGGDYLASILKTTRYGGVIACCGNAASPHLAINVYPFILRGVTLAGIDSAECSLDHRRRLWSLLAGDWRLADLDRFAREIRLAELPDAIDRMLAGGITGRLVIALDD